MDELNISLVERIFAEWEVPNCSLMLVCTRSWCAHYFEGVSTNIWLPLSGGL